MHGSCAGSRGGIPLWTKVMRKEARHTQMRDRASGVHPDILEHLPPKKTRVCLLYCFVLSPLISLGAVPHHHLALSVKSSLTAPIHVAYHRRPGDPPSPHRHAESGAA